MTKISIGNVKNTIVFDIENGAVFLYNKDIKFTKGEGYEII